MSRTQAIKCAFEISFLLVMSRPACSFTDPSPMFFAILVSARFSAYFTLPIFQPWTNVVSSVTSHF